MYKTIILRLRVQYTTHDHVTWHDMTARKDKVAQCRICEEGEGRRESEPRRSTCPVYLCCRHVCVAVDAQRVPVALRLWKVRVKEAACLAVAVRCEPGRRQRAQHIGVGDDKARQHPDARLKNVQPGSRVGMEQVTFVWAHQRWWARGKPHGDVAMQMADGTNRRKGERKGGKTA